MYIYIYTIVSAAVTYTKCSMGRAKYHLKNHLSNDIYIYIYIYIFHHIYSIYVYIGIYIHRHITASVMKGLKKNIEVRKSLLRIDLRH